MNLPISKEEAQPIIDFLNSLSCCYRCITRFLGLHVADNEIVYKDPRQFFNEWLDENKAPNTENTEELSTKRLKKNICPVCLDCFEHKTVEKFIEKIQSINIEEYKYNNFFFNVSFPKCLALRAHGMYLHLKKNFPDFPFKNLYTNIPGQSLEQPHKIFRLVASEILSRALNRNYHSKSNLSILLTISYENDNVEVENFKKIFKKTTTKKNNNSEISRNYITDALKDIDNDLYKTHFSVPPTIPEKEVFLENVAITADPVYLGGRYLKFKRNVGQTPWVVDGVSVSEHNVQDIIFDAVCNVLGCDKNNMTFTASGREDVDVRMLGTGRPFYIKIDNPKERNFSKKQFLEVQKQIIKSELAAVIKLQIIYASDLSRIKLGEEQKKKTYRALCKTSAPNIKDVLDIINKHEKDLQISQKTVLRVLHRRTLLARDKIIHKMKATEISGYAGLFELELVTQAGTYVKEFVHGDFKRTEPSISSILKYATDLVALDCMDINLIWPENDKGYLNSEQCTEEKSEDAMDI